MNRKTSLALGAVSVFALCGALFAAPSSVELKLLVKPELFADRAAGYRALWRVVSEKAAALGMPAKAEDHIEEESEIVRYYDTADKALDGKSYTVRQKFKVKKGVADEKGELMLKLRRGEEISDADRAAFKAGLSDKMKYKYEEDRVGLVNGEAGRTRSAFSASAKQKKLPNADGMTVQWLSGYFPTLTAQSVPMAGVLKPLNADVLSVEAEVGEVKVQGKEEADIETAVWYNMDKTLQLVEVSWKYKPKDGAAAAHEKLFRALQDSDIFVAGRTKTGK